MSRHSKKNTKKPQIKNSKPVVKNPAPQVREPVDNTVNLLEAQAISERFNALVDRARSLLRLAAGSSNVEVNLEQARLLLGKARTLRKDGNRLIERYSLDLPHLVRSQITELEQTADEIAEVWPRAQAQVAEILKIRVDQLSDNEYASRALRRQVFSLCSGGKKLTASAQPGTAAERNLEKAAEIIEKVSQVLPHLHNLDELRDVVGGTWRRHPTKSVMVYERRRVA